MSSLARGRGLEGLEIWLAGLFSAAELAAAQLLLHLSVAGAGESDEEEEEEEVEERVVEETALAMQSAEERVVEELDRRARKRYRRLSELYAATSPVISDSDSDASVAKKLKRGKRHHHHDGFVSSSPSESSAEEATRYGGDY